MFKKNLMRAELVARGLTYEDAAKMIDKSLRTFTQKMNDGSFTIEEASKLIKGMGLDNGREIFLD